MNREDVLKHKKKKKTNRVLFRAGGQRASEDPVDGRRARHPDARRRFPGPGVPGTGVSRSPVQVRAPRLVDSCRANASPRDTGG